MSPPAENARSPAATTTTRVTASSFAHSPSLAASARTMACVTAFNAFGRLSVTMPAVPRRSNRMSVVVIRQEGPAVGGFVEAAVELQAQPSSGEQHRQADEEQPDRVGRHRAFDPEPYGAHGENGDADGLKDGALLVLFPAPQAAPDGHQDASQAG